MAFGSFNVPQDTTTADWNEANPTSSAYIANKTHYVVEEETNLMTVSFTSSSLSPSSFDISNVWHNFEVGAKYAAYIDGKRITVNKAVAQEPNAIVVPSNIKNPGEPDINFYTTANYSYSYFQYVNIPTGNHVLIVSIINETVKTLDDKYLNGKLITIGEGKDAEIFNNDSNHAEGWNAHSEGQGSLASGDNQHVFGMYNEEDRNSVYVEIVGNGSSDNARSNARTLDWEGNETLAGDLDVGGDLRVAGDIDIDGDMTVDNLTVTEDLIVGDDTTIGGDLTVTGPITSGSTITAGADPVNDMDVVTKQFLDDTVDDIISGIAEQVPADWNQNDNTEKDYVKNRTHHIIDSTTPVETSITLSNSDIEAIHKFYYDESLTNVSTLEINNDLTDIITAYMEYNNLTPVVSD